MKFIDLKRDASSRFLFFYKTYKIVEICKNYAIMYFITYKERKYGTFFQIKRARHFG